MPSGPFLGASMGKMFDKTTEGVVQGQMQRMLLDREDRQDALRERRLNEEMEYRRDALGINAESKKQAQMKGFIDGAMNFYKTTGNAEATKNFWNQNAPQYGLMQIDRFEPIDQDQLQVHFENGAGILVNKTKGTVSPLTSGGQPWQAPRTLKQQAEDFEAETKIGEMSSGDPDRALPAAGITTGGRGRQMTPDAAMKEKIHALESLKKIKAGDGDNLYAQIVAKNLGIDYQKATQDPEINRRLEDVITKQIERLDAIIGGQSPTSSTGATIRSTALDQNQTVKVNGLLKGKPANVYTFDGGKIVVKWDGQRVIQ